MDVNQRGLLYLFERPFEPLKVPRANGMIQFQQTVGEDEALSTPFESMGDSSDTRFGSGAMLMNIPMIPDILDKMEMVKKVPKGVPYSHFDPVHVEAVKELTQFLMDPKYADKPNYWQYCGSIKESVNEGLFIYALSYAIIRNPAIDSRLVPAIYEVFPNMFISQHTMDKAKDMVKPAEPEETKNTLNDDANFSGPYMNLEHRVAYWREDYGMNAHHWHWHVVFPGFNPNLEDKPRDRKGEIFSYMHSQMLGRFDWERLSNGVDRLVPLDNWHDPIPDGYFPNLTISNRSSHYGNRPDNMTLYKGHISVMEPYRQRFLDAIQKGYMINANNEHIQLSDNVERGEKRGIDILGDTLEPDRALSVDINHYGNLHGLGHVFISRIHDPEDNHRSQIGPIGNPATAARDPAFYRWHKFVDMIFQRYKMTLQPYEDKEVVFDPVLLESVLVKSDNLDDNVLETGWTYHNIEVSRGLDFGLNEPISVRSQHLTHKPFIYNLQVTNNQTEPVDVTVRLYMAPMLNEEEKPMTYMDQRLLWAEMDRYHTTLEPGLNSLERLSTKSSITILEDKTFRGLEADYGDTSTGFCGCGWPQHLLLPKGKAEGMDFQIFALISDWELDKVSVSAGAKTCSNAASYCGILNEKYPDARPMGYPFDRRPNPTINDTQIENVTNFAEALPNAAMCDIKIYFKDMELFPE